MNPKSGFPKCSFNKKYVEECETKVTEEVVEKYKEDGCVNEE